MPFQITMSIAREVASVTRLGIEVGLSSAYCWNLEVIYVYLDINYVVN